jgi:hypothetical protein
MISEAALGILVFASAGIYDLCHARYVAALGDGARHRAARWSVGQWLAATIALVVAVRVTLWYLPLEAAGLYVGTLVGTSRASARS